MKNLVRVLLGIVFFSSIALIVFLLHGQREKETWAAIAAALAVIAAVTAAWPAIRLLEIQEDAMRPRPTPHFDLTSRYSLLQLRVKNLGAAVAYDVHLTWKTRPIDHKGAEITNLDRISALLPQESVSVLVGPTQIVREMADNRFEGEIQFKDSSGRKYKEAFVCSVDGSLKQLVFDNELPRALHDLQEIPKELNRIAESFEKLWEIRRCDT